MGLVASRADTIAEAFAEVEKLRAEVSGLAETMGQLVNLQTRGEAVSRVDVETHDGANELLCELAPVPGGTWIVQAVAVVADATADRLVELHLTGERARSLGHLITESTVGGTAPRSVGEMVLPTGAGITARFPAAVPAGTRCALHVIARELLPND